MGANSTTLPPLLIGGFTDTGITLGYQHEPLGSAAVAQNLTPPAQTFTLNGGATVNFDVRIKLGSTVLTAANVNVINGAADYAWYATAEFVVLSTGASGSLRRAGGELGFAFTDSTPAWNVGDSSLNTTADQTVSVTVTPSVASPSNTLTLETITVRADHPAQTG